MFDCDDDAEGQRFNPKGDAWQDAVAGVREMCNRSRQKREAPGQDEPEQEPGQ
ncbi:hypothetical protein [Kitasatospora sp. NPDC057738]|uniref:hypothetical protein n=1 Tax=Kitasatospora sp. NPDC057738 TaxID=3346233 RepID=UPI0036CFC30C